MHLYIGAKVIFSDVNTSGRSAADTAGKNALFIECDISSAKSVKNLVAKTLDIFGTNVGILHQKPISETSDRYEMQ
jgi:hypothetical protein